MSNTAGSAYLSDSSTGWVTRALGCRCNGSLGLVTDRLLESSVSEEAKPRDCILERQPAHFNLNFSLFDVASQLLKLARPRLSNQLTDRRQSFAVAVISHAAPRAVCKDS